MSTQTVVVTKKKWYESKTIWFNFITLILGIAGAFNADVVNAAGITSKQFIGAMGVITAVGNQILRVFFTTGPIGGGSAPQP